MHRKPLFANAYPRGGQVALLCEGDAVGYEAKLLKQYFDSTRPSGRMIDVWPCGTGNGVRGMADAIGRTVPVGVILDRDFKDETETASAADGWNRDAETLGWSWLGARHWQRNEIENYFLDDDVLQPVMTTAFGCSDDDVAQALDTAVKLLVPFQSLQAAFQKTRCAWERSDPTSLLAPCRPSWVDTGLQPIDPQEVRADLQKRLLKWQSKLISQEKELRELIEPWCGDAFFAEFDNRITAWSRITSTSQDVREVWAGKEVLKLVRQQLCTRGRGWWSCDPDKAQPVAWHAMKNNAERNRHDREIEKALLPELVNRLTAVVESANGSDPRRAEFDEIGRLLSQ